VNAITEFKGEYRWLSNFYPCDVTWASLHFPSVEHAYQAAKFNDVDVQRSFQNLTAGEAKRQGRDKRLKIRPDWDKIKLDVMEYLLTQKFLNHELRRRLLATQDAELVEGNWWGDKFWGVCEGEGLNHLGKLLMKIRDDHT